jgi:hypothetical protein
MLDFELSPQRAGVVLWGDSWTLRRLHDFIHRVNDSSPLIEDKEGFMLGLAYDVRKAFQGTRRKSRRTDGDDKCSIYGVEILWPVLIAQAGLLRESMAFMPTTRLDQAVAYELEAAIEAAAADAVPGQEQLVMQRMQRMGAVQRHIETVLDSRCRYFIALPPEQRLPMLLPLLDTFEPMYESLWRHRSDAKAIPPETFKRFQNTAGDWPDFEW